MANATCSLKPRTDKRHRLTQRKGQIVDGALDARCSRCGLTATRIPVASITACGTDGTLTLTS